MPLTVNLRHLEAHNLELRGEIPLDELDLATGDEVVQANAPLGFNLEVQRVEDGLLVQGRLELVLDCECVRCLKSFKYPLVLENWTSLIPLQGEDAVPVVNDNVDLTPIIREDILLEFPQHPVCKPDCGGLPNELLGQAKEHAGKAEPGSPAWAELNKLKF